MIKAMTGLPSSFTTGSFPNREMRLVPFIRSLTIVDFSPVYVRYGERWRAMGDDETP